MVLPIVAYRAHIHLNPVMRTASRTNFFTRSSLSFFLSNEYSKHAKSQCSPSSREINSFENVRPGIKPRFFSQNITQKLPERISLRYKRTQLGARRMILNHRSIAGPKDHLVGPLKRFLTRQNRSYLVKQLYLFPQIHVHVMHIAPAAARGSCP